MPEPEETPEQPINFGTGLHAIIITYDESSGLPEVDIGSLSPYLAITMLHSAIESLEYLIPAPSVVFKGQIVFNPSLMNDEEEPQIGDDE